MESRDLVSVSRLDSRPIFASLGLGLERFRSRLVSVSKAAGLETLNIAKKWYSEISIIQQFFVGCICR